VIGDGWDGEPSVRPGESNPDEPAGPRRVAVVTGSRAEYGLLRPVMRAIEAHPALELLAIAAGSHLVQPALTFRDVKSEFKVADAVPMQIAGRTGRIADAEAVGRGIARFARSFSRLHPDWVVVLGDRIEAFAAASATSIAGIPVAHLHAGDRAEGVADESLRHAITKLSHLHLAATERSAERVRRMGERTDAVFVVGSPAIDRLETIAELDDRSFVDLGSPEAVVLMHPLGRHAEEEEHAASAVIEAVTTHCRLQALGLDPNFDAGRHGILRALDASDLVRRQHLPRDRFVGLLKRVARAGGVLVGNSSAGLIEAAALGLPAVDIGDRQSGRERADNIVHAETESARDIARAIREARSLDRTALSHPYGDGRAGQRTADLLAKIDPHRAGLVRKRNVY